MDIGGHLETQIRWNLFVISPNSPHLYLAFANGALNSANHRSYNWYDALLLSVSVPIVGVQISLSFGEISFYTHLSL